jgi:hypothetical protein
MSRHTLVDLGLVIRRRPSAPTEDRLPDERLSELLARLRTAGVEVRDDAGTRGKLAELRALYEPFLAGLSGFYRLPVPAIWPVIEASDNWQTSAWMRRADPLSTLVAKPSDDHFN